MAKTKLPNITFVTPWLEFRFPKVTKPDTEGKYADGKFKTYGIALNDSDHAVIESKLREAAASKEFVEFFKKEGVTDLSEPTLPIKEFKNKQSGDVEEMGFNFKSKYRPAIFDGRKKKLPETAKIGNGSEARIETVMFPWAKIEKVKVKDAKGKMTTETQVGFGVSMRFQSAQMRKLVEGGGSSDGSAFEEDDSFEYEGQVNDDGETEGSQYDL